MDKNIEGLVEKHYWRAVSFLIVLILLGTGFWSLRRFQPTLFLGKPDFIAVPNEALPKQDIPKQIETKPKLLNINTTTAEELQTLSGVGPQMSQKIIQHREAYGSFSSVQDLTNVKGIGEKTLEKLKPFISVE